MKGEIQQYLKPPKQDATTRFEHVEQQYWTAQQLGRCRSNRIQKISFTGGYTNAVQALDPTLYNLHKQSAQEYRHFANTVINEEMGHRLEYIYLIEHPKFSTD